MDTDWKAGTEGRSHEGEGFRRRSREIGTRGIRDRGLWVRGWELGAVVQSGLEALADGCSGNVECASSAKYRMVNVELRITKEGRGGPPGRSIITLGELGRR